MEFTKCFKWFAAGFLAALAVIVTVSIPAAVLAERQGENGVYIFVEGANDFITPIIYDGKAFVPVADVAEILGIGLEWYNDERGSFAVLTPRTCINCLRLEGNSIIKSVKALIGYLKYTFGLPAAPVSGVTWEFSSIGESEYVTLTNAGSDNFTVSVARNMPCDYVFSVTFEQNLDGRPLGYFLVYEIAMVTPGAGGWPARRINAQRVTEEEALMLPRLSPLRCAQGRL